MEDPNESGAFRSNFSAAEITEIHAAATAPRDTADTLQRDGLDIRPEVPDLHGVRLPRSAGNWGAEESLDAVPGHGDWYSDRPEINSVTGNEPVSFVGGYPDFSDQTVHSVEIPMTGNSPDFTFANRALAARQEEAGIPGSWRHPEGVANAAAGQRVLEEQGLTWHHEPDGLTMSAVPSSFHHALPHEGGAALARAAQESPGSSLSSPPPWEGLLASGPPAPSPLWSDPSPPATPASDGALGLLDTGPDPATAPAPSPELPAALSSPWDSPSTESGCY